MLINSANVFVTSYLAGEFHTANKFSDATNENMLCIPGFMQQFIQQLSNIGKCCTDEIFLSSLRFFAQDYIPLSKLETCQGTAEIICLIIEQKDSTLDRNCDYLHSILTSIQVKLQRKQIQDILDRLSSLPRPKFCKSLKHLAIELDTEMKASPPYHFESLLFLTQGVTRQTRYKHVNDVFNKLKAKKVITDTNIDFLQEVFIEMAKYDSDLRVYLNIVRDAFQ